MWPIRPAYDKPGIMNKRPESAQIQAHPVICDNFLIVPKVDEDGILSAFSNSPSGMNKVSCDSMPNPPVEDPLDVH